MAWARRPHCSNKFLNLRLLNGTFRTSLGQACHFGSTESCWLASSLGRLRNSRGRLTFGTAHMGYRRVCMFGNFFFVHRVVAFTFLGPPKSALVWRVHHKDGDPTNNRLDNLTYVTQSENVQQSYCSNPFRGSSSSALSTPVVWRNLATTQNWTESPSITSAAKSLGLSPYIISKHCRAGVPIEGYQLKFGASSEPVCLPGEEWLPMKNPLTGHVVEGRKVSSFGRLRSRTGLVTRGCKTVSGYFTADLREDSQRYQTLVHRLVAYAFLGPPPTSQHTQVNHKDLNRGNNCVENLEYVTPSENVRHFHATLGYQNGKTGGAVPVLARPYGSKGSWVRFSSIVEAAKVLMINRGSISKCVKGLVKCAGTHEFCMDETEEPDQLQGEEWRPVDLNGLLLDKISRMA